MKRKFKLLLPVALASMALLAGCQGNTDTTQSPPTEETPAPVQVLGITLNCESEPYGKAVKSITYQVNSTQSLLDLTADDFQALHCVYDAMETHEVFDAPAHDISFSKDSVTVEVEPFYPDNSYSREGYWTIDCTNDLFDLDATTQVTFSDPVAEAFEPFTQELGSAKMECYLYTPAETENMPLVIFNSGGSGISTTGDVYGANFAVSFAKEAAQDAYPCYVLYPQRNEGETDDLCAAIKDIADGLVEEGKVDPDRIYVTGESAGSLFTMEFVSRYPGYAAAIAIFDGGYTYEGETLEETVKEDAESPFSDAEMKQLAESGTKVMLVQSLGDTTSYPLKYATTYTKLVQYGMKPMTDIVWHYYTAEQFNALLSDGTTWAAMADSKYVTDPITGVVTYDYPEGKLHNGSYPAANDFYIKMWLMNQHKGEYEVEFSDQYSALTANASIDFSIIPDYYTKTAVLENAPGIPAGSTTTLTVYTNDDESLFYISFTTPFNEATQYVEAINVGGVGHTIMDCSGTWWTTDVDNSIMPYILSQDIDWQPYEG